MGLPYLGGEPFPAFLGVCVADAILLVRGACPVCGCVQRALLATFGAVRVGRWIETALDTGDFTTRRAPMSCEHVGYGSMK